MTDRLGDRLSRWVAAGVIDSDAAQRIRAFEEAHAGEPRLRWPVVLALGFGTLLLGAGVLLFVASHWDALSPAARFTLVLSMVALFHLAGAVAGTRTPTLAVALHAVGTVAVGAGVYLSGQIFNMAEHWPAGLLLWAVGAWIGWLLLRHEAQLLLAAALTPAWYASEWIVLVQRARVGVWDTDPVLAGGGALLAISYFTVSTARTTGRGVLVWLGGVALLPALAFLLATTSSRVHTPPVSLLQLAVASAVAIGVPLVVAVAHRGIDAWVTVVAAGWIAMLLWLPGFGDEWILYGWWALGAIGLAAWGVREGRVERINVGSALFAIVVLVFYFSSVMDKLGRAASLTGLGLLFLAGGWALERTRRRLVHEAREWRA